MLSKNSLIVGGKQYIYCCEFAMRYVMAWDAYSERTMNQGKIFRKPFLLACGTNCPKIIIEVVTRIAPDKALKNTGCFILNWCNMDAMEAMKAGQEYKPNGKTRPLAKYHCELQLSAN